MKRSLHLAIFLALAALAVAVRPLGAAEAKYRLAVDNKIQAQVLVADIMAANPELLTAGMHGVAPGAPVQSIIASTLNVIGKPSDPPDIEVGQHGETILSPNLKVPKLGIMLPLHDRMGQRIGALALAFRFPAGADPVACLAKAIAIRDRVAQRIASRDALFAATP